MLEIKSFTFNAFQENTYILFDETKECAIIDPGCSNAMEEKKLADFIEENKLKPTKLLNTHCHIDHILGNRFVAEKYNLKLEINEHDLPTLEAGERVAQMYNIDYNPSPEPSVFLTENDKIKIGNYDLEIFFTPGHSPGSITFYNKQQQFIIAGDVLFYGSIGRTDLPGGNHQTLIKSIKQKLFLLKDVTTVYSGHGITTTIGFEKLNNPFLKD